MRRQGRSQLALGIILILLGAWFIAQRMFPEVAAFAERFTSGSLAVVGVGIILLLLGLILGAPGWQSRPRSFPGSAVFFIIKRQSVMAVPGHLCGP
jgi:hypothetical protein